MNSLQDLSAEPQVKRRAYVAVVEPHSVVERQHGARGDVARCEESLPAPGHRRLPDPDQVHLHAQLHIEQGRRQ